MRSPTHRLPLLVFCALLLVFLPGATGGEGDPPAEKKLKADGASAPSTQVAAPQVTDDGGEVEIEGDSEVELAPGDDTVSVRTVVSPDGEVQSELTLEDEDQAEIEDDIELEPEVELIDDVVEPPPLREGMPVGKHTNGYLVRGKEFPIDDDRFVVLAPWRAYCAQDTVDGLFDAVDAVESLYPGSHAITVGDCSRKGGGHLRPHMSHQTGLDIDIGPYWADGDEKTWLEAMHPHKMDIPRTWALIEALVSDESVKYIILDYRLQQVFYEYAQELPWMDQEYLDLIFQYPRGPKHYEGIIRHWEGHYSHLHVRFHCPEEFADTCVE